VITSAVSNEGLDEHQLELLLQGLSNVITLPTPENAAR